MAANLDSLASGLPKDWRGSNPASTCELALYALLWLQTVALENSEAMRRLVAYTEGAPQAVLAELADHKLDVRHLGKELSSLHAASSKRKAPGLDLGWQQAKRRYEALVRALLTLPAGRVFTAEQSASWTGVAFTAAQLQARLKAEAYALGAHSQQARKALLWMQTTPRSRHFQPQWWELLMDTRVLGRMLQQLIHPPSDAEAAAAVALRLVPQPEPAPPPCAEPVAAVLLAAVSTVENERLREEVGAQREQVSVLIGYDELRQQEAEKERADLLQRLEASEAAAARLAADNARLREDVARVERKRKQEAAVLLQQVGTARRGVSQAHALTTRMPSDVANAQYLACYIAHCLDNVELFVCQHKADIREACTALRDAVSVCFAAEGALPPELQERRCREMRRFVGHITHAKAAMSRVLERVGPNMADAAEQAAKIRACAQLLGGIAEGMQESTGPAGVWEGLSN